MEDSPCNPRSAITCFKRPVRILYFTQYAYPDSGAPAVRSSDFSQQWTKHGFDVRIISSVPGHTAGVAPPGYLPRSFSSEHVHSEECMHGVRIMRCPAHPVKSRSMARMMLGELELTAGAACLAARLVARWRPDIVLLTVPQFSMLIPALAAADIAHAPLVLEIRDVWPDELIPLGFPAWGPLPALLTFLMSTALRRASRVVTVTEGFKTHFESKGIPGHKITVIPHGADFRVFRPLPVNNWFRYEHGWGENEFVFLYAGNMGRAQGLDTLLEAVALFPQCVKTVLVGNGCMRNRLENIVYHHARDRAVVLDSLPHSCMPWVYASADTCLVPLRRAPILKRTVPSKLCEVMACGRPVVASLEGEAAELVRRSSSGVVVEPESPQSLARAVTSLASYPKERMDAFGQSARTFAEQHFDRREHTLLYERLFREVLGTN